jgi:salicylate hydroxylase
MQGTGAFSHPADGPATATDARPEPQQATHLDVAVIGGGPGGLAAAKAILTARPGLRVAVFERSSLRPKGASVMVQPNGVKALAAINPGLAQGALDINCHLGPCWLYRNDKLQLLQGAENPTDYIESHGGPTSSCAWHELQSLLAHSLPPGVLHQEVQFDRFEEAADGSSVTLHFKGGRPPMTTRLIVGADGGQSGVRQQVLADGPPLYQDTAIWRAVMPQPEWWPKEPGSYCIWGTPPNTVLAFSLNGGMLAWQAYAAWPADRLNEIGGSTAFYAQDFLAKQEQGEARRKRAMEMFADWNPQVRSLIEGADALAITEHGQFLRTPESCRVWGKGCATLLGDAAHMATPMLAQGTSQAFEDAVALGRAIAEHGATPKALRAYEAVRQPQMDVVQGKSVELFKQFKAGNAAMKEHKVTEELGIWERHFAPLAGPSSVAA